MFLLLLADGFEEIEALGTLDLLRRAGIDVLTATLNATPRVLGAHGIAVEAQAAFPGTLQPEAFEGLILPGGMGGATALANSEAVCAWVRAFDAQGKRICAICAAPALLFPKCGLLTPERTATCYPAAPFIAALGSAYRAEATVTCGHLITGAGPGAFAAFARAIAESCQAPEAVARVWTEALL